MIILKVNKVNVFVSSVLFVFWYHEPSVLDIPHIYNISRLRVKDETYPYRAVNTLHLGYKNQSVNDVQ
jgi:hypothetical protein